MRFATRKLLLCAIAPWLFMFQTAVAQQPSLLDNMTPSSFTTPPGWSVTATDNFTPGCASGTWCNGNFDTVVTHNGATSLECQYGNSDCGGSLNWNKFLPVNSREVYVSWYEMLDSTFRMNDEMFLARFHWDTGNGQPIFRENILDYFQNSSLAYNSTNATLLHNIQGAPYYQNKLPSNTSGDTTNFTFTLGAWVQWQWYTRFSTVAPQITLSSGVVTLNAAARTYTRTTGSWITDGIHVGDAPHFTGFSTNANNLDGTSGGGGYSGFVTSVTDTVMTVSSAVSAYLTNDTATNPTMQVDRGDGAFALYKITGGVKTLIGYQTNMVNPGKVDFGGSVATTLSLGESYSKLIWHQTVGGNCETTAPFTGTCSSNISGCGYDNLAGINGVTNHSWDGAGLTRSPLATSPFNTHIPCDATWGGPMPTPPLFKRRIADIIVLTRSTADAPTIGSTVYSTTSDSYGHYWNLDFPGYAAFKYGDGAGIACPNGGNGCQGLMGFWDLKNDAAKAYNYGALDTGLFEHQWNDILNSDGSGRNGSTSNEYKEAGGSDQTVTVADQNNVRLKLVQTGPMHPYGDKAYAADCCMTMTKTYSFYRNGAGGGKVYTTTVLGYSGADGFTSLNLQHNYGYSKINWSKTSGEFPNHTDIGCGQFTSFTPTPWQVIYQAPGDYRNKDWQLLAPATANGGASEQITGNICAVPNGPTIGHIWRCNTPTSSGCASTTDLGNIVHTNFLQIAKSETGSYMPLGNPSSLAAYFSGGLRFNWSLASRTLTASGTQTWQEAGFIGDNGITTEAAGNAYKTEYKTPPAMTMTQGTGGTFDALEGYWSMAAAANHVTLSANGTLHSPVFYVTGYSGVVPQTITVGGVTKILNTDYVADFSGGNLLLQIVSDVPASTTISFAGTGTVTTPSPTKGKFKCKGCKVK